MAGLLMILGAYRYQQIHATRAHFLIAGPDAISNSPELLHYALPRGRQAYSEHCAACHGENLRGDPGTGIPDLRDADWLYGTGRVGDIERIIRYGIRSGHSKTQKSASMPAFAAGRPYARYKIEPLTPREVDDVSALLYSFRHPAAVDAATVARGSVIYHGKGLCFDCHSDHAQGDSAIGAPNLTDSVWLYGDGSMISIKAAVSRGLAGVCPPWGSRLKPDIIRAIAVYVHTAAEPARRPAADPAHG